MKKLLIFLAISSVISAVSCSGGHGGDDDGTTSPPPTSEPPPPPTPVYMDVGGTYALETEEIENTCRCDGPRDLPQTIVVFDQNVDATGAPTGQVYFSGGGLHFGGTNGADTLDKNGNFTVSNLPYSSSITLNYTGAFSGENDIASNHETVGPIHLRLDYANGCCNGAGYNIITMSGPKNSGSSTESSPVPFITGP